MPSSCYCRSWRGLHRRANAGFVWISDPGDYATFNSNHTPDGTATISSKVNYGTTVTLFLPRAAEALNLATPLLQAEIPSVCGGNALVVDDDTHVAAVCAGQLENLGYRTQCAESGHMALDLLQRDDKIDLVVSDILMPGGINGLELAHEIRNKWPRIAILLMTGYAGGDKDPAGEGFVILRKPFNRDTLAEALQRVLRENRTSGAIRRQ